MEIQEISLLSLWGRGWGVLGSLLVGICRQHLTHYNLFSCQLYTSSQSLLGKCVIFAISILYLILTKVQFTFHLLYKHSGKSEELSHPKKTKHMRPHSSNFIEVISHCSFTKDDMQRNLQRLKRHVHTIVMHIKSPPGFCLVTVSLPFPSSFA